ncbi:FtsH protease activity modulator HflK [Halomonas denitrificans]|uniref:FtsH protease activity modulator HflK n=1 Tax=Halomonas TaxID=2745 RepID=UPI001C970891|nr:MULTISPECIES: FtsH protease activity modulator HflK [Halomonas]MBY6028129.1 FtsH protease activity modulator HflK [Halomonas sp. DP8Y7-1]MBY6207862.1 FtsH protease activity modulator HflK [Halomonas sp. DP3Y7-2]MBY6228671.1 FtsH protease activity modulator HflK [Halomonas sp. DP3Y7-1]MCA0916737.1 FtsH protease activity modulator HflK [Halomonas denitrificans]MCA0975193.1 FtsH protease activity modulator HflK [Halomonas denitrificans]
MAWNEPGGGNGNQHDPWSGGGRRGGNGGGNRGGDNRGGDNQGPPDLDEALKKFQDKLNGMLGGRGGKRGGGSGGKGGGNRPRNTFALPGLLIVIGLAVWAASGFYLVDQSERGVVLRFGKFQEVVTPGLQWNPPLIDDVRMVNVTRVRSVSQTQSMLTQDENIVSVEMSAQYQVADPRDYVLNVRDPELSLENALDSALRHVVGGTDMIDILTSGREILGSAVASRLQTYLDNYGTGIRLVTLNVESTSPPDAVQDAFDDVIRAREDRQRTINQAMAYANAIIPEAQGQAQRIVEQGQGYRESVVAEARGQANRFTALLTQYRDAPEIMRERLYLDTISEVLGQTSKVLVDVDQNSPLMVLPMDRLGRGGSSQSSSESASSLDPQVLERLRAESGSSSANSSSSRSGRDSGIQREGR